MVQKNEAERLRLGIRGGWLKIADAVAWADRQIDQTPQPDLALVDLALAQNRTREEVVALLEAVPGSADSVAVMRCCLNDLLETVEREPRLAPDAARWLEAAANRGELPESEFGLEAFGLDDAFALAEQGTYGTLEDARDRLVAFLRQHSRREASHGRCSRGAAGRRA